VVVVGIGDVGAVVTAMRPRLRVLTDRSGELNVDLIRTARQAIEGFREIRVLGVDAHFRAQSARAADEGASVSARRNALSMAPRYIFEVALVCALVLIGVWAAFTHGAVSAALPVLGSRFSRQQNTCGDRASRIHTARLFKALVCC
jgi:hypothetical protein